MKIKDNMLGSMGDIQDVWGEAEKLTSVAVNFEFIGPDVTVKEEMKSNVEWLLLQQAKVPSLGLKMLFEQVYKEEGITL